MSSDWPKGAWSFEALREGVALKEVGEYLRELAEHGDHRALASLARIVQALGYYQEGKPPSEGVEALERVIARELSDRGVNMEATHTVRMLRAPSIGSPRAALAEQICQAVERVLRRGLDDPRDEIAGTVAVYLDDWSGTPELYKMSHEGRASRAYEGLPETVAGAPSPDPESLVRAALRGVGLDLLGITAAQLKNLYSYKTKREERDT